MRILKIVTGFLGLLMLAGCASGFREFYQPAPDFNSARITAPPSTDGKPQMYVYTANPAEDDQRLMASGYVIVGWSSFNGPSSTDVRKALDQAKDVGAHLVMVRTQYSHTVSGAVTLPVTTPGRTVTSYTQGTASAYGSGGSAYGTYNGTTTTYVPGTTSYQTTPYSVSRNDFLATYWAKASLDSFVLGVYIDPTTPEMRQRFERNGGVVVKIVVDGTPAFSANLLPEDIIYAIAGTEIISPNQFIDVLRTHAGQKVAVQLMRNGEERRLDIQLAPQR